MKPIGLSPGRLLPRPGFRLGRFRNLLAAGVLGFLGPAGADAVVIDDFSYGPLLLEPTNYSPALVQVQTGLPPASTAGGARRVRAQTQEQASLAINPQSGELTFESVADFGYFMLEYGTEAPLGLDVRADGSDAFLLNFSNAHVPGLWRGIYALSVNGVRREFLNELAALNGPGTVRIPFSQFSTGSRFIVNHITLDAARVESHYRLTLDSITTGSSSPAPPGPGVGIALVGPDALRLAWSTNELGYRVEKATALSPDAWEPVTNSVNLLEGQFAVTLKVETAGRCTFFRLRKE